LHVFVVFIVQQNQQLLFNQQLAKTTRVSISFYFSFRSASSNTPDTWALYEGLNTIFILGKHKDAEFYELKCESMELRAELSDNRDRLRLHRKERGC